MDKVSDVFEHLTRNPKLWDAIREDIAPEVLDSMSTAESDALDAAYEHGEAQVKALLTECAGANCWSKQYGDLTGSRELTTVFSAWWAARGGELESHLVYFGFVLGIDLRTESSPEYKLFPFIRARNGKLPTVISALESAKISFTTEGMVGRQIRLLEPQVPKAGVEFSTLANSAAKSLKLALDAVAENTRP